MNRIFAPALFLSALLALAHCKKPQEQVAPLTAEALMGAKWRAFSSLGAGLDATFSKDSVRFDFNFEGVQCAVSSYTIAGNKVQLAKGTKCPGAEDFVGLYQVKDQACEFRKDEKGVEFKVTLQCNDLPTLGQVSSVTKAGDTVSIDGKDYVAEGMRRATISSAVKFRSAPDANSKPILFQPGDSIQGPTGAKTDTLIPQTDITLVARTKDKLQVRQWNNYWYYVMVSGAEIKYGWVYGEFVNLNP